MIRIDEPTLPSRAPTDLRAEVARRSSRFRRQRRQRGAALASGALALGVALFALSFDTAPDVRTTARVGSDGRPIPDDDLVENGTDGNAGTSDTRPGGHLPSPGSPATTPEVTVPGAAPRSTTKDPSVAPRPAAVPKLLFHRGMVPYEVAYDGTGLRQVAPYQLRDAQWSPDGRTIAAMGYYGDLVLRDVATGREDMLFDARTDDSAGPPDWMTDNRTVVFQRTRKLSPVESSMELWTVDVVTRELHLVRIVEAPGTDPVVTPDGRISYICTIGNNYTQRICLTDRNGTDLGHVPNSGSSTQWEWSPDGRWIVMPHWDNGNYGVAVLRSDGSEQRVLLTRKVRSFFGVKPLWLPDGSRIVFSLEPPDSKEDPCTTTPPCPDDAGIWSMRVDGSDLRPITTGTNDDLEDLRG